VLDRGGHSAELSFLGLEPPPFTGWGTMLTRWVRNLFNGCWWQVYPPLIVLVLVVVAFRQAGDALNGIVSGQRCGVVPRRRFRLLPLSAPDLSRYQVAQARDQPSEPGCQQFPIAVACSVIKPSSGFIRNARRTGTVIRLQSPVSLCE
jgi:hypothetical protein